MSTALQSKIGSQRKFGVWLHILTLLARCDENGEFCVPDIGTNANAADN